MAEVGCRAEIGQLPAAVGPHDVGRFHIGVDGVALMECGERFGDVVHQLAQILARQGPLGQAVAQAVVPEFVDQADLLTDLGRWVDPGDVGAIPKGSGVTVLIQHVGAPLAGKRWEYLECGQRRHVVALEVGGITGPIDDGRGADPRYRHNLPWPESFACLDWGHSSAPSPVESRWIRSSLVTSRVSMARLTASWRICSREFGVSPTHR